MELAGRLTHGGMPPQKTVRRRRGKAAHGSPSRRWNRLTTHSPPPDGEMVTEPADPRSEAGTIAQPIAPKPPAFPSGEVMSRNGSTWYPGTAHENRRALRRRPRLWYDARRD